MRRAVLFYLCIAIFAFAQSSSAPPSSKEINMDLEHEDVFQKKPNSSTVSWPYSS